MLEVWSYIIPTGIIIMCAYGAGYISGSEKAKEIYNPVVRKNDVK